MRNGVRLGSYPISALPLNIEEFPFSGNDYDFIRVCINDNEDCCRAIEFLPASCGEGCDIFDVEITVGDCVTENTYVLTIDFQVTNPGNEFFEIFVRNNELIDFFSLEDELPLVLEDFERSGNEYDFLKICINDVPDCCFETEFMPPECLGGRDSDSR